MSFAIQAILNFPKKKLEFKPEFSTIILPILHNLILTSESYLKSPLRYTFWQVVIYRFFSDVLQYGRHLETAFRKSAKMCTRGAFSDIRKFEGKGVIG